jgi:hypothetical protein
MTTVTNSSADAEVRSSRSSDPSWDRITARLGPAVAYYPRLVELTLGAKAAILLCQMLYWTRTGRGVAERDGWFYKTASQWTLETGLSRREQATARRDLVRLGVIEERIAGIPARLYFRVGLERLEAWLGARLPSSPVSTVPERVERILGALGPPTPYFPRLTGLASSANCALLLSRSIALARHGDEDDAPGIVRSMQGWCRDTGLSAAEYQLARRTLSDMKLWRMSLHGIPARTCVALDVDALSQRLAPGWVPPRVEPQRPTGRPDTPANGNACEAVCAQPAAALAPCQFGENTPTGMAQTRELKRSEISGVRLQTTTGADPERPLAGEAVSAPVTLEFPPGFDEAERAAALRMLAEVANVAQDILDEVHARIAQRLLQGSPLQYLRALVGRAQRGEFAVESGVLIRAMRRRRALEAEAYRTRTADEAQFRAWQASPEYPDVVAKRREEMRRFIESARQPKGQGPP